MTTENQTSHAIESRARRAAKAAGYVARKSRWRANSCDNYGGFMLINPMTNFCVAGEKFDLSAEAVIDWATELV
jgi:hypothetical protein